jgi:hypothetical protein
MPNDFSAIESTKITCSSIGGSAPPAQQIEYLVAFNIANLTAIIFGA